MRYKNYRNKILNHIVFKLSFCCFLFFVLLYSCNKDVEVIDEGKVTPVVYGVIDIPVDEWFGYKLKTPQYISLTKSFIGKRDAYKMAKMPDSLYFKNAIVSLEYCSLGTVLSTTYLEECSNIPKDNGVFSTVKNIVYQTVPHIIPKNIDSVRLIVELPDENKFVTSTAAPKVSPQFTKPAWRFTNGRMIDLYEELFELEWLDLGGYYEVILSFYYDEKHYDGSVQEKRLDWVKSRLSNRPPDFEFLWWLNYYGYYHGLDYLSYSGNFGTILNLEPKYLMLDYYPESFYTFLKLNIESNPGIISRKFKKMKFTIVNSGRILYDYIQIQNSHIDYSQAHSNIINGLGVFTCKSETAKDYISLTQNSIDSLADGQYTNHLKFTKY